MRLHHEVQARTQQPPIFTFISRGERASSPGGAGHYPAATNLYVYFPRRTCVFTRRCRPLPNSHQALRLFPQKNVRLHQGADVLIIDTNLYVYLVSSTRGSGPYPAATNLYDYFPRRTFVFTRRFRPLPSSHQSLRLFPQENVRLHQEVQALTQQPSIFTFISPGERASSPGGSGPYPAATNLYVNFPRRTCVFTRRFRPLPSSHQSLRLFPQENVRLHQEVQALSQQPPIFTFISPGERASSPGGSGPYPAATDLYVYFPRRTCVFTRRFRPLPSSHQSVRLFPQENVRLHQEVQALTKQPPIFTFISPGERASSPGSSGPYTAATNIYVYFRRWTCAFTRKFRPLPSSH